MARGAAEPDNLALFRVGRVLTKERHPNADKLWLCTVDVSTGSGGVHQIVCGAQNFAAGDTVAVSLAGATLGTASSCARRTCAASSPTA